MGDGDDLNKGSSSLFAVFVFSILSLFLIPYTIYKLCGGTEEESEDVKPWEGKKRGGWVRKLTQKLQQPGNLVLILLWLVLFGLAWFISTHSGENAPFDPYQILQIERGATDKEIRKAYRNLSLQYHPDKNPDPVAAQFFAEKITKAYAALTDEASRENYEKYGHPDGRQGLDLGIALPEWMFMQDNRSAPVMLLALVFGGILLPLGAAACYIFRSNKFIGANNVMQETIEIFFRSKFAVKESQSLVRIPDTLVYAMEYINLPTPALQQEALEELRKTVLRLHPDLKEKPQFWKRKPSLIKVHMLLLAHLGREPIPAQLQADMRFVLEKALPLLEEIVKIGSVPRTQYPGWGWLAPTMGAVEMMQCVVQAVPMALRKSMAQPGRGGEGTPLPALPYIDVDTVKRLGRKKIRSITDLMLLPARERESTLVACGLSSLQAEEVNLALSAIPNVTVTGVTCAVDGEDDGEIMELDIVTCSARVLLTRASHAMTGAVPPRGGGVLSFAPYYPLPRRERWYFVLAEVNSNSVVAVNPVTLLEAEQEGVKLAQKALESHLNRGMIRDAPHADGITAAETSGAGSEPLKVEDLGQLVTFQFRAPRVGKYDFMLYVLSDSWVGCDRAYPLRLKVTEKAREAREERRMRRRRVIMEGEEGEEVDAEIDTEADPDDEEEEDEPEEDEYDSEETGTEESGSEMGDTDDKAGGGAGDSNDDEAPELINLEDAEPDPKSALVTKKKK